MRKNCRKSCGYCETRPQKHTPFHYFTVLLGTGKERPAFFKKTDIGLPVLDAADVLLCGNPLSNDAKRYRKTVL